MKLTRKLTSIGLALCLTASAAAVGSVSAGAATDSQLAQDTVEGSAILHCFDWSYNNIKANLAAIAAAGYTAVQTSPVQAPKDYSSSYTDQSGQWWKLYQPLGLSVADGTTWLGTKAELQALCEAADDYGIKVIVDIVETGTTLKENGLEVFEDVCPISARLIANTVSMKLRQEELEALISKIESYFNAQDAS